MVLNDAIVFLAPPVLAEPYSRLIAYSGSVGLSPQQLAGAISIIHAWRLQAITHSAALYAKKQELDLLTDARPIDLPAMLVKCDEYTTLLNGMLHDSIAAPAQVNALLTQAQFDALSQIYENEKATVPLFRPGYI
jgi:hypothetical protein